MSSGNDGGSSLTGLAKRWFKNQLQVHGDPQRAARERQESEAIEQEFEERVSQQAQETVAKGLFDSFAPAGLKQKVAQYQQMAAEQQANETARRQAEHEAKPRAAVQLTISGDLAGALIADLPATIDRPAEAGEPYLIEMIPLVTESIAGRPFQSLTFAIPGYRGAGEYDLERMGRGSGADNWDPLWFFLVLESGDEPFYRSPNNDLAATVIVEPGEQIFHLRMAMTNVGSEQIVISGSIELP